MRIPFLLTESYKTALSFGLTSGIITTLGVVVGLHSGTHSMPIVIGGILTIAFADSLSDAMGIHVAEEAENRHSAKEIWASTVTVFITKLLAALTFVLPIALLPDTMALAVSIAWGLLLLTLLNIYLARELRMPPAGIILEHVVTAILVVAVAHVIGQWIETSLSEASWIRG